MNTLSVRALLVRGMLAGLAAGVAALLVAYFLGESRVDAAIALEEHAAYGHHDHGGGEEELVSRALQATGGLATGVLVFGVAIGGIAAIAFCVALGRIGRFGPRATAAFVALGGLIAVYVVPFLKYPANPPAVGDGDTIGKRTALFFLLVLLSVLLAVGAVLLGHAARPAPRQLERDRRPCGAAFLLAVTLAYVFLPSYNEVGPDFPGQLLWQFRLATLAVQAVLWTVFGLVFGALAERLLTPESARPRPAETVAA